MPGTRIDSSHGLRFSLSPWEPSMSPWSLEYNTMVFSRRPSSSSFAIKRPT